MSRQISEAAVISASEDVAFCELAGGAALLDLRSSTYYNLNAVGLEVWTLIQDPKRVADVRDTLLARYDVDPSRCHQDLIVLLKQLADADLIKITDAANP